jgi:GntR family transcriptional regulator
LNQAPGSFLTCVSRVIYTGRHPIAFLVDNLPTDILPVDELLGEFSGSVLDLLLQRENPHLSTSRTEIKAVGATPDVAKALQIQRDDVLLHFEAQLFNNEGRVVDYSISHFLPGYFRFHVVRRVGSKLA